MLCTVIGYNNSHFQFMSQDGGGGSVRSIGDLTWKQVCQLRTKKKSDKNLFKVYIKVRFEIFNVLALEMQWKLPNLNEALMA